jgi:hypothetical protein
MSKYSKRHPLTQKDWKVMGDRGRLPERPFQLSLTHHSGINPVIELHAGGLESSL